MDRKIKNLKIAAIDRRGKNILFTLIHNSRFMIPKLMVIHPKMTGHLLVTRDKRHGTWDKDNYIRAVFTLDNGLMLAYSDVRKFGKILFGDKEKIESLSDLKNLGPEPLDKSFKVDKFISLISSKRRKIKEVLMNQEIIVGLGNIYSDEALWLSKIHPLARTNKLSHEKLKNLHGSLKTILGRALKARGSSLRNYLDTDGRQGNYANIRLVYARKNQPCRRCGTKIKRTKLGARSAHYCPWCQKI